MCAGQRLLTPPPAPTPPSRRCLICSIGEGSKGEVMEKKRGANDGGTTGARNAASPRLPSPQGALGAFGFEVGPILALVQTHDTSFGRSSELDQSLGSSMCNQREGAKEGADSGDPEGRQTAQNKQL